MKTISSSLTISIFLTILAVCVTVAPHVYAKEISYTLEDRDRLIRVEEGLKAVNQRFDGLDKRIDGLDKRIDGLDKRIDGLQGLMYVLIGSVIAQTIGIVGFVLWDRRTALAPAIRKTRELEEREETIEKILKDYAKQEPRLAEILKSARLL